MGWAFEGVILKPGKLIEERELWPDDTYPKKPLLIEYAGIDVVARRGGRSTHLYILWRYDRDRAAWRELARASAIGAEWVEYIKPVAMRELDDPCVKCVDIAADATARVLKAVEFELQYLGTEPRRQFIAFLYEEVTARLASG
jgi:hypothetical protein